MTDPEILSPEECAEWDAKAKDYVLDNWSDDDMLRALATIRQRDATIEALAQENETATASCEVLRERADALERERRQLERERNEAWAENDELAHSTTRQVEREERLRRQVSSLRAENERLRSALEKMVEFYDGEFGADVTDDLCPEARRALSAPAAPPEGETP
jgi:predicted RNase H-like nuclease (RuvC/YqgF family)